ncbi:MAG: HAMP domain-containing sensor histidine kinase [Pseudomonadota bacterium]
MERQTSLLAARGLTDERDRLLSADEPLAELHARCGGTLPGVLAVPELLDLVQQARRMELKIARDFSAYDGVDQVSGYARIRPLDGEEGPGCEILVENWQTYSAPETSTRATAEKLDAIDRACAEVVVRLDDQQRVQLLQASGADTSDLQELVAKKPNSLWTDHIEVQGIAHQQPMHWRLLDGSPARIPGSERSWRVRILPLGSSKAGVAPRGFELLLIAERALGDAQFGSESGREKASHAKLIGSALTPILREPIARVVNNAEAIRGRLAGPLRQEYSEYAGNISAAAQHLSGLLDDLAELEIVEAPEFTPARERVDLGDLARRAAGILGVRARSKNIELALPIRSDAPVAMGESRRVLQILINLIGNAINYSPENTVVTIAVETHPPTGKVRVTVLDDGPGIDVDQAARVFNKFERLGRENDGGSGLGLYISSRLAEAMGGALTVANPGEQGALFELSLPGWAAEAA